MDLDEKLRMAGRVPRWLVPAIVVTAIVTVASWVWIELLVTPFLVVLLVLIVRRFLVRPDGRPPAGPRPRPSWVRSAPPSKVLRRGLVSDVLGRDVTVTVDFDGVYDPLVLVNEQANPRGLPDGARAWYRAKEQ